MKPGEVNLVRTKALELWRNAGGKKSYEGGLIPTPIWDILLRVPPVDEVRRFVLSAGRIIRRKILKIN